MEELSVKKILIEQKHVPTTFELLLKLMVGYAMNSHNKSSFYKLPKLQKHEKDG